jgi:periplasmic mercuric ion binding protein
MKSIRLLLVAACTLLAATAFAQSKTVSFKVSGNCGMCKKRIEKAATGTGVERATWNVETKMMTVIFDASKVSEDDIQKKIAAAGHDTQKHTADNAIYEKLPGCCLYEREKPRRDASGERSANR